MAKADVATAMADAASAKNDAMFQKSISGPIPQAPPGTLAVEHLFFATDRKVERRGSVPVAFGPTMAPLTYGQVDVTIPKNHQPGTVEKGVYVVWKLWPPTLEIRPDPARSFVMMAPQILTRGWFEEKISETPRKRALIFIHGFNTSFEDAAFKTAQIVYDTGFDGAAVFFSWPSLAKIGPREYVSDQDAANSAAPDLATVIKTVRQAVGSDGEIYLIAHSMGNLPLVEYLFEEERPAVPNHLANAIVFAAPDVDANLFRSRITGVTEKREHMTLYASSTDKALMASADIVRTGNVPRAGQVINGQPAIVMEGIDSIDVSALSDFTDLGHGTYSQSEDLLGDIRSIIKSGSYPPPDKRAPSLFTEIKSAIGVFWRAVKGGP